MTKKRKDGKCFAFREGDPFRVGEHVTYTIKNFGGPKAGTMLVARITQLGRHHATGVLEFVQVCDLVTGKTRHVQIPQITRILPEAEIGLIKNTKRI